jgi:hypothetical protein
MWLLGGGRKDGSESSKHSSSSRGSKTCSRSIRRRSRKENKSDGKSPASTDNDRSMHMAETCSGIEVSLSHDKMPASPTIPFSPTDTSFSGNGVISLHQQLAEVSKIYRAQFNVYKRSGEVILPRPAAMPPTFRARKHRIPLFKSEPKQPTMLFDDYIFLLRSHDAIDELACVQDELTQMDEEIVALELDRTDVKELATIETPAGYQKQDWEIHRQLLVAKNSTALSSTQRTRLQEGRGLSLTVHFQSKKAQEALMSKCGCKATVLRTSLNQRGSSNNNNNTVVTLIAPQSCRDGGAAATIQHLSLLKTSTASSDATSFFLSRDSGKSYQYGRLPDRLFRRMNETGVDPQRYSADLLYLSTGPLGCYYAEFRSGECWWGLAVNDPEFDRICRAWDVYRVAFGPCTVFNDGVGGLHGRQFLALSWIVLARDGKAAWKNVPARLHSKLSRRIASDSAPTEVALGHGDVYFVRFLDGTSAYRGVTTLPDHRTISPFSF